MAVSHPAGFHGAVPALPSTAECLRWLPRRGAPAGFHVDARKLAHFIAIAYTYSLTALIMGF